MKPHLMLPKVFAFIALIAVLAACSGAPAQSTQTTGPTVDVQPTLDQIGTQAAQTIIAGMTLNAPTATPVVPTDTPMPTETATPVMTNTPVPPTNTPTATWIPWTSTPAYSPTPPGYACSVTSTSPASGASLKVNSEFDGKWVVKNTGTKAWEKSAVDIKYVSGTKFQTKGDLFDLGADVASKDSYTIIVDMLTPKTAGSYKASWAVVQDSLTLCTLSLNINVVN